jgi:hypothetical protein
VGRPDDETEAEMDRLNEILLKLEADRTSAMERFDQIEEEPSETPEQASDKNSGLAAAERKLEDLQEQIDEAQADWERAQADWLAGSDDDDADGDTGERLSVWDAADIWLSNGMDEDYMFGYTEDELRRAAKQG